MTIQAIAPHPEGVRYAVRPIASGDFDHLRRLEAEIWSGDGAGELCPHYLRLCTELYPDWCFLAFDGDRPVGYVLNFVRGTTVYCATLAVHPEYQKGRVNYLLIRAMVAKLLSESVEECRFLVEPGNTDARSVHNALGARVVEEVHDFYAPGDTRLWSTINREDIERVRARYTRLKLVS
jgi:hypothetical protein